VQERASIQEVMGELEIAEANVIDFPTEGKWESMSLEEQRSAIRGVVRRIVVTQAPRHGGRHDRGIDLQERVRFELRVDDKGTASAIGKVLFDAIDWNQPAGASPEGITLSLAADVADALEASPLARRDLLLED
jgi:hypothetical protein